MNTEKVFIGFTYDNHELLLYRKNDNTYINLLSDDNSIYPIDNVDVSTLIPASNSLNLKRNMLLSSIKKKYLKDREQLINTNNIYLCTICEINNVSKSYHGNNILDATIDYNWTGIVKNFGLFIREDNNKDENDPFYMLVNKYYNPDKWVDILSGEKYIDRHDLRNEIFKNGTEYVDSECISLNDMTKESYMSKKRINECANEAKKITLKKY